VTGTAVPAPARHRVTRQFLSVQAVPCALSGRPAALDAGRSIGQHSEHAAGSAYEILCAYLAADLGRVLTVEHHHVVGDQPMPPAGATITGAPVVAELKHVVAGDRPRVEEIGCHRPAIGKIITQHRLRRTWIVVPWVQVPGAR
jgi:hypothetical protein